MYYLRETTQRAYIFTRLKKGERSRAYKKLGETAKVEAAARRRRIHGVMNSSGGFIALFKGHYKLTRRLTYPLFHRGYNLVARYTPARRPFYELSSFESPRASSEALILLGIPCTLGTTWYMITWNEAPLFVDRK